MFPYLIKSPNQLPRYFVHGTACIMYLIPGYLISWEKTAALCFNMLELCVVCFTGAVENWRMAANLYTKDHPKNNYFSDLIMIHMSLGLGVKYGKAVALASLVGLKFRQFRGSGSVLMWYETTKPVSGRGYCFSWHQDYPYFDAVYDIFFTLTFFKKLFIKVYAYTVQSVL